MTSHPFVTQGFSPEDDYGLAAIVEHNASAGVKPSINKEDNPGLGIYVSIADHRKVHARTLTVKQNDGCARYHVGDKANVHNPPTPHSNSPSDSMVTRSGQSIRRTDSPFSTTKSRVSKSPATRPRKERKGKLDKSKTPKLTAPLSVLTKDMAMPMKDMDAWVNRPAEVRRREVAKREGYVTRPMNSFMLYRSAYADRTKQWCLQNNHQVVSSLSGESWPMEPAEVRDQFNEWAKTERANHAAAHPNYKFSPSKAHTKRRKNAGSDDEDDEVSDVEGDPDGEYRGGRVLRQRKKKNNQKEVAYLPSNAGFESTPYYTQLQAIPYDQTQYQFVQPGRPLPSDVSYDQHLFPYDAQMSAYTTTSIQPNSQYQPVLDMGKAARMSTPQSLGDFGLPGGQSDELFPSSRMSTPLQHVGVYGQPMYQPYQMQHYQHQVFQVPTAHQVFEHQRYLQSQARPQQSIDPALHGPVVTSSHYDEAIGAFSGPEYYDRNDMGPDATLAPSWSPTETLR